jgi:hypothetical protein
VKIGRVSLKSSSFLKTDGEFREIGESFVKSAESFVKIGREFRENWRNFREYRRSESYTLASVVNEILPVISIFIAPSARYSVKETRT